MKIDTSTIEGFDTMSDADKLSALLGLEFDDNSETVKSQKSLIDKYTSQIAEYKKKERQALDDSQRAQLESDDRYKELEEKYNELLSKSLVSDYKAKYLAMGYDEVLAEDTAKAYVEGNTERVFENGTKFAQALEKKIKADVVKSTGKPDDKGSPSKQMTRADIMKIKDTAERQRAIEEHIELFTGGKE